MRRVCGGRWNSSWAGEAKKIANMVQHCEATRDLVGRQVNGNLVPFGGLKIRSFCVRWVYELAMSTVEESRNLPRPQVAFCQPSISVLSKIWSCCWFVRTTSLEQRPLRPKTISSRHLDSGKLQNSVKRWSQEGANGIAQRIAQVHRCPSDKRTSDLYQEGPKSEKLSLEYRGMSSLGMSHV